MGLEADLLERQRGRDRLRDTDPAALDHHDRLIRQRAFAKGALCRKRLAGVSRLPPLPSATPRESHGSQVVRSRGSRRVSRPSGGSSDDPGGEPPPAERPCPCGCGADLADRRPQTLYASDACRKRIARSSLERVDTPAQLTAQEGYLADVLDWAMDGQALTTPTERAERGLVLA